MPNTLKILLVLSLIIQLFSIRISCALKYEYNSKINIISIILNPILYFAIYTNHTGSLLTLAGYCLSATVLLNSSIIDLLYLEIPDSYNAALGAIGIVLMILDPSQIFLRLSGTAALFSTFVLIAYFGGDAVGGGDIKLVSAIGVIIGVSYALKFIILSLMLGAASGLLLKLIYKALGRTCTFLPFCPLLAISTVYIIIKFI